MRDGKPVPYIGADKIYQFCLLQGVASQTHCFRNVKDAVHYIGLFPPAVVFLLTCLSQGGLTTARRRKFDIFNMVKNCIKIAGLYPASIFIVFQISLLQVVALLYRLNLIYHAMQYLLHMFHRNFRHCFRHIFHYHY